MAKKTTKKVAQKKAQNTTRKTFTNLEVFFMMICVGCLGLAVGYNNIILAGVSIMTAFFALVSLGMRATKK